MLFTSMTIGCLITYVQTQSLSTQNSFLNQFYNPGNIYFNDNRPGVVPLSIPNINEDAIKNIFQAQPVQPVGQTTVEVEKSQELAYTSSVGKEQVTDRNTPTEAPLKPAPTTSRPSNAVNNNLLYSVTNFGVNLLKSTSATQPGNIVISPFSITTLLALLQQGALGQTKQQISTALQMTPDASLAAYTESTQDFKDRIYRNILKTANNIFVADEFNLNPDFKRLAQRNFDSDVTPVSFAKPELIARQINSWVASRTNNKIDRLVSPDSLDTNTQIVLVNAIYFKGLWDVPFRVEATKANDFHLSNGQTKTAQFMRMRKLFKTGVDSTTNAQVIILPFERDQYSLMVILPNPLMGLANTIDTLTDARLLSYHSFQPMETNLELPRFTISSDIDLAPVLKQFGITKIFSSYAELNGVGVFRTFSPQISSAVHSAVLSIDEKGGSAAAATSFAAVALSFDEPSVLFKADRPFIAVLWDNKSSLPLFMAKIEDPKE